MPKLITSNFSVHNAKQFKESWNESSNTLYYIFAAGHVPYEDLAGATGSDSSPPTPSDSVLETGADLYKSMIFGKKVNASDVYHMCRKNVWISGTRYDMYDDQDGDLSTKNFFVVVNESGQWNVFKCLNNNKNGLSTSQPSLTETSADDDIYIKTADGYQWKYMFTIPSATYDAVSTANLIPIVSNTAVESNAVSGAIDVIKVSTPGSRYFSTANAIVTVPAVAGNTLIYELQSTVGANVRISSANGGPFVEENVRFFKPGANLTISSVTGGPFVAENVRFANTVDDSYLANATIYSANSTHMRIVDIDGTYYVGNRIEGLTSSANCIVDTTTSTKVYYANAVVSEANADWLRVTDPDGDINTGQKVENVLNTVMPYKFRFYENWEVTAGTGSVVNNGDGTWLFTDTDTDADELRISTPADCIVLPPDPSVHEIEITFRRGTHDNTTFYVDTDGIEIEAEVDWTANTVTENTVSAASGSETLTLAYEWSADGDDVTMTWTLTNDGPSISTVRFRIFDSTTGTGNFTIVGPVTVRATIGATANAEIDSIDWLTEALSANTDFFKNMTMYVKAGTGAGQVKNIDEYIVTGGVRRILIANAFTTQLDTTSRLEITPRVTISGDGSGAEARSVVNTSTFSIDSIQVVNRGSGYTHANAIVQGNTGIINVASGTPDEANDAVLQVVMGPSDGHGADPVSELYSSTVGLSVLYNSTESGNIPTTNDFRTVGLIKDPLYANVKVTFAPSASFQVGETVTQVGGTGNGASGVVTSVATSTINLRSVFGQFTTDGDVLGGTSTANGSISAVQTNGERASSTFDTFDQRTLLTGFNVTASSFNDDSKVIQATTAAEGYIQFSNSSLMALTRVRGNFLADASTEIAEQRVNGGTGHCLAITAPDLVEGSGEVLYIENMKPISRATSQTERIQFYIDF